jgi:hypothetical protein
MTRTCFFVALLSGLLFTGCNYTLAPQFDNEEAINTVQVFAQKMKYEHDLFLEDSVVYFDESIHRFRLDFSTQNIMTLCQGRVLIVDLVEDFLSFLNGNGALLANRKTEFFPGDVEIYITFTSFYSVYNDINRLGLITMRNGLTHFFSRSTFDFDRDHWKRRSEFYWQSRAIVEGQRDGREAFGPQEVELTPSLQHERLILAE